MELIDDFDSNYRYILVAARRARQLQSGARPMVETATTKPCRIAEQEVHAHKVAWFIPKAGSEPPADEEPAPVDSTSIESTPVENVATPPVKEINSTEEQAPDCSTTDVTSEPLQP